jgi:hypothetical protein
MGVRKFPHVHPNLDYVVLDFEPGDVEVQAHDGVRAVYWARFSPFDFGLLQHVFGVIIGAAEVGSPIPSDIDPRGDRGR